MTWPKMSWCFVALLALCLPGLTACDDDDENTDTTPPTPTVVGVTYTVAADLTEDQLQIFDIQATYTDPQGRTATETVTSGWSKTFNCTSFPATFSIKMTQQLKPGVQLDRPRYTLASGCSVSSTISYSDGSKSGGASMVNSTIDIKAGKINDYLAIRGNLIDLHRTVGLNADKTGITEN